ncbi:hypothetical protein F4782DRAFT_520044 [Xylaria castorea]|nr:hypothetical protein F4782DRAFT_520044 [Xylaria castorea]
MVLFTISLKITFLAGTYYVILFSAFLILHSSCRGKGGPLLLISVFSTLTATVSATGIIASCLPSGKVAGRYHCIHSSMYVFEQTLAGARGGLLTDTR